MGYCSNCGTQLSGTANFCPNCGAKVAGNPNGTQTPQTPPSTGGVVQKPSVSAGNIIVPILIMFIGGWVGDFISGCLMGGETLAHRAAIVYMLLSGIYIYVCYQKLEAKSSKAALSRSIFVMLSGVGLLVFTFFTYACDSVGLALMQFVVSIAVMIVDSILAATTSNHD